MEFLYMLGRLMDYASGEKYMATIKSMETNIIMLHARASTIEEQIKMAELSGRKKTKRDVHHWLAQVEEIENEFHILRDEIEKKGFLRHFFSGGEAARLDERVHWLLEQSQHFGELVLDNKIGDMLLTNGLVGEQFEKNLENIFNFLMMDDMPGIGIYGMGGVGKTSLAKHINNRIVERTQGCVVWVTVSQEYTISMLQDKIAEVLNLDLSDEYDEGKRAFRLNWALSSRNNTLLILDDVWNFINLEKLGAPLSINGCKLMITTRSQKLCHQIGCRKVIEVKALQENDAWNLFRQTLGEDVKLTPQVQDIAKSMVRLCDGLPLGIVTLAQTMRGESAIHVWRDSLVELRNSFMGQRDMEEQVFDVLRFSYDKLDSRLKHCFLYCSLYPENYNIDREELIRKFIVEEFLDKRYSRKDMFDQGHAILDKLVSCCLLEAEEIHDQVKMHDLLRAMALKLTQGKYMVITRDCSFKRVPNEEEWGQNLEKISLSYNSITEIPSGMSPNCPKLSTLLLDSNPLQFIPDTFFLQICGLGILDLSRTDIKKLPDTLSDLESLKALLLKECMKLASVPSLVKLKALRELDLTLTAIDEVPKGIEELINLQFLSLDKTYQLEMLPRGFLQNLQNLQCLYLPYHIRVQGEEVARLKHLEEFRGRLKDVSELFLLIKSRKSLAYSIEVGSDFPRYRLDGFRGYNQLILSKYGFNEGRDEDLAVLAQGIIRHLTLHLCEGHRRHSCLVEDLSRMSHPSLLESLELYGCEETEYLLRRKQFVSHEASPPGQAVFPYLKQLEIFHCNKLKRLGLLVSEIPNLEKITVAYCKEIEEIMEVDKHNGRGESKEANVGIVSLPKLKCLFLEDLPKLKSFCDAKVVCNSIETISLWGCPMLMELPLAYDQSNYDSPLSARKSILKSTNKRKWDEELEIEPATDLDLFDPAI